MSFALDVDLHSDEDAFRWLHTDEEADGWTVWSVRASTGEREEVQRSSPGPWLPGAGYDLPRNTWPVGRSWCHLEIEDGHGGVHAIGRCDHTR